MVRAGVCLDCAVPVYEQIMQHAEPGKIPIETQPCSGSCYEAIEHYLADPLVWRLKPDPIFGCGGKARQAKPQNSGSASVCLRGDASKKQFRH
jgi:hypothetical protein